LTPLPLLEERPLPPFSGRYLDLLWDFEVFSFPDPINGSNVQASAGPHLRFQRNGGRLRTLRTLNHFTCDTPFNRCAGKIPQWRTNGFDCC
jgi:hypothetical protein